MCVQHSATMPLAYQPILIPSQPCCIPQMQQIRCLPPCISTATPWLARHSLQVCYIRSWAAVRALAAGRAIPGSQILAIQPATAGTARALQQAVARSAARAGDKRHRDAYAACRDRWPAWDGRAVYEPLAAGSEAQAVPPSPRSWSSCHLAVSARPVHGAVPAAQPTALLVLAVPGMRAEPLLPGGRALLRHTRRQVQLVQANATISTLGGGHFLVGNIERAMRLALLQFRVACELGDRTLQTTVALHAVYNALMLAQWDVARSVLLAWKPLARAAGAEAWARWRAAAHFALHMVRLQRAHALTKSTAPPADVNDEYRRYRIVG